MNVAKWILVKLMFKGNKISIDSNISGNSIIGRKNIFKESFFINSIVSNNSLFDKGFCSSCKLGNNIQCSNTSLHSVECKDYFCIKNNSMVVKTTIGKYTYMAGRNSVFHSKIGSFCSIAENVTIGHAEHPLDHVSTSPLFYKSSNEFNTAEFTEKDFNEFKETTIGNDVWIGANAFIKSGVTIGDGAVIGAGSVVTKNVDSYAIVSGVPAKLIRYRFEKAAIDKLLKLNWWNMSDDEIKRNKQLFRQPFYISPEKPEVI